MYEVQAPTRMHIVELRFKDLEEFNNYYFKRTADS